jgi:endonuclease IV
MGVSLPATEFSHRIQPPNSVIRAKSIATFRGELERAAAIGTEYLILRSGSYRGRSVEETSRR